MNSSVIVNRQTSEGTDKLKVEADNQIMTSNSTATTTLSNMSQNMLYS